MSTGSSPRTEVGEIDTRPPFQSVKAAVNLFADVSTPNLFARPSFKKRLLEHVLDKETQLLLAQSELNNLKQQLESAELTRSHAFSELDRSQRTLRDLTAKLNALNNSKQLAAAESAAARELAKRLESEKSRKAINGKEAWGRESERVSVDRVAAVFEELEDSRRELAELRRDFAAATETKLSSIRLLGEAQLSAAAAGERAREISAEIAGIKAAQEKEKVSIAAATELKSTREKIEAVKEELDKTTKNLLETDEEENSRSSLEAERLREDREEAERLRKEAEGWRAVSVEAERRLREVEVKAEAARDGERKALEEMRSLSEGGEEARKVILSVEEFDTLAKKVDEAQNSAELKEAESLAAVHGITARKVEALRKLEANLRTIEEIKAATDLALRTAEMSDSAKVVVESEIKKWRQDEQRSGQL